MTLIKRPNILDITSLREKCSYSEFLWSVFSLIRAEYGEIPRMSPYSVRIRENTNQKNSEYGHFSRRASCIQKYFLYVLYRNLPLKKHKVLPKTASSENTGRYFVFLAQGTVNVSSKPTIRFACFLYFIHLILKVPFLTF